MSRQRVVRPTPASSSGSHSVIAGNATRTPTRTSSAPKKGSTPRKVCRIGTSGAWAEMMKTFMPTGGVMRPSSTTISARIPNHIFRSSVLTPKGESAAMAQSPPLSSTSTGQKNGMVSRIIDRLSIRHPRMMSAASRTSRVAIGVRPETAIHSAIACGTPPRDMKILSSSAPSRIR